MGITRFSLLGIAAKKASSFVGKAAAAASHPVGLITRFLSLGIGGRRTGAFSGKTPSDSGGTHPVVKITRLSLLGVPAKRAGSFTGKVATDQVLPQRPFAETSIWNTKVPVDARLADIQDAIWGNAAVSPTQLSVDLVSILAEKPAEPLVNFKLTQGWSYPDRSLPRGGALFQRRLAANDGTSVRYPKNGNAAYIIINQATGATDEGVGAWRDPGGDFLTYVDGSPLHSGNAFTGEGLTGPRAAGLSYLGGCLRSGEISTVIPHALAISANSRRYSTDRHFVSPAVSADSFASDPDYGYLGPDINYTIGTLMVIPASVGLDGLTWATPQGRVLATCAQEYGWYIVDSGSAYPDSHIFNLSYERTAAANELGLLVDPETDVITVNPANVNYNGLNSDVQQILRYVKAVIVDPALPVTSGGGYFRHTYPERRINIKDDDEKILFMAVKILLETGRL